jgi:hypothetical protein
MTSALAGANAANATNPCAILLNPLNISCGWTEEEAAAWEQALRLAPNDQAARQEMARVGRLFPW